MRIVVVAGGIFECGAGAHNSAYDIVIVNEEHERAACIVGATRPGGVVLLNSDNIGLVASLASLVQERRAGLITYGLNQRACITASSISAAGLMVCVQRGFSTAHGETIPQEFAVATHGLDAEVGMALAGAMLLCGLASQEITQEMQRP